MPEHDRVIGLVLFPGLAALDIVGPYEVLASLGEHGVNAGYRTVWISETLEPVRSHQGLTMVPEVTFEQAPPLDVIVVPGGPGQAQQMSNVAMIAYLKRAGRQATTVCSVCTGALLLAKAGFLIGKKATTHWMAMEELEELGATPVKSRVVKDGKVITAAGVSAGIDMALTLAAELAGEAAAQAIQLNIEYDPKPPFDSGSPEKAPPEILAAFSRVVNPDGES
ncbi:MAG: DJ-1/PfpI family protein [Actinomycetota bacterium]